MKFFDRTKAACTGFIRPFPEIGLRKAFLGQVLLFNPLLFLVLTLALGGTRELRERWTACVLIADIVSGVCFAVGAAIQMLERWQVSGAGKAYRGHTLAWHFLVSLCAAPFGLILGYRILWVVAAPLRLGTPRPTSFADFRVSYFIAATIALFLFLLRKQFEVNLELSEETLRNLCRQTAAKDANRGPAPAPAQPGTRVEGPSSPRLTVRHGSKIVLVKMEEISAALARGRYVGLVANGSEMLVDETLDELATQLDPGRFFRVHRSAIVNLEHLRELKRVGDRKYFAVLNDPGQTKAPVSRDRLAALKAKLGIT